jgi:hypothetical protein
MIAALATPPRGPTAAQAAAQAQDAAVLAALRLHTSPGGLLRPAELAAHLPGLSAGDVAASLRRLAVRGAAHRHHGPDGAREYRASEGPAWRSHAV